MRYARHRTLTHSGARQALRAGGIGAILLLTATGLAGAGTNELPSSVRVEQWETVPTGNWITGALNANNSGYSEGESVPFRLVIPARIDVGQYTFSVCRNFDNGSRRGYLYLTPFDTDRAAVPGGTITSTMANFSAVNATIDSATESEALGACKAGDRETIVTITKASGEAYILWGGHLASPLDPGVGTGNGASAWPGASLHMKLLRPSKDVAIQTCSGAATATPIVTATVEPTPSSVATAEPTDTAVASVTPAATASTVPTSTMVATRSHTPTSTHTSTPTTQPASVTPGTTNTPSTASSETPVPADTPVPSSTPVEELGASTPARDDGLLGEQQLPGDGTCQGLPTTGHGPTQTDGTNWLLVLFGALGLTAVIACAAALAVKSVRQ